MQEQNQKTTRPAVKALLIRSYNNNNCSYNNSINYTINTKKNNEGQINEYLIH